jgi:hypothetical protein
MIEQRGRELMPEDTAGAGPVTDTFINPLWYYQVAADYDQVPEYTTDTATANGCPILSISIESYQRVAACGGFSRGIRATAGKEADRFGFWATSAIRTEQDDQIPPSGA